MGYYLYFASFLLVAIAFAHSYLGERYILIRLFKRKNLPKLFGGTEFTTRTLRFAWHLTSIAWIGFAAILVSMVNQVITSEMIGKIIGLTFLAHFLTAFIGSKGRHLAWPVFLLIGILSIYATS